nr:YesL family protein [Enterococcus mundtii]
MLQKLESTNKKLIRLLQLIYLNFLWGILVVLGLGLFTFGPASYAMVSVIRKWLRSSEDFPLTQTYFHYFKENYKETLLISWLYFQLLSSYT